MQRSTARFVVLTMLATLAFAGSAQASSYGGALVALSGQGAGRANLALTTVKECAATSKGAPFAAEPSRRMLDVRQRVR